MDPAVQAWLTRLSEGQAALHAHAARVDENSTDSQAEVEALTESMNHDFRFLTEQMTALAGQSRRTDDRMDGLGEDILRGFYRRRVARPGFGLNDTALR